MKRVFLTQDVHPSIEDKIAAGRKIVIVSGSHPSTASEINPINTVHVNDYYQPEGVRNAHRLMKDLLSKTMFEEPTNTHKLIGRLHALGLLTRYYTEAIVDLDKSLGVPRVELSQNSSNQKGKYLQLHGSIQWLRCSRCFRREPHTMDLASQLVADDRLPHCPSCLEGE